MRLAFLCLALLVACGGGGGNLHTLSITNATQRKIDELYVHAPNADKGTNKGPLAAGASTKVKVKEGGVEVLAVSELMYVDQKQRDRPSASQVIEITGETGVVFYDEGKAPPGLDRPGFFGISFKLMKAAPPPEAPLNE